MSDAGATRQGTKTVRGILTFIAADMANFLLFFGYFMVQRLEQPDVFSRSAGQLDIRLGLLNTAILVTSGWLVALAVAAARAGDMARVRIRLLCAIGVGLCFAIVKTLEYGDKLSHGITPQTNVFFAFYYVFTGVHLLHYAIGIALLMVTAIKAGTGQTGDGFIGWIESCALFWHMVDLLWIFLFAMLYLQGAA